MWYLQDSVRTYVHVLESRQDGEHRPIHLHSLMLYPPYGCWTVPYSQVQEVRLLRVALRIACQPSHLSGGNLRRARGRWSRTRPVLSLTSDQGIATRADRHRPTYNTVQVVRRVDFELSAVQGIPLSPSPYRPRLGPRPGLHAKQHCSPSLGVGIRISLPRCQAEADDRTNRLRTRGCTVRSREVEH